MTTINVAAGYTKPACLSSEDISYAQILCTQQRSSGQEAVGLLGLFGLGTTSNVDYSSAIKSSPCDWAQLPKCATPAKPSMRTSTSPSIMTRTLEVPPATVSVMPPPPPPVAPKSKTPLIVGGVLLAALLAGGVIYYVEKR